MVYTDRYKIDVPGNTIYLIYENDHLRFHLEHPHIVYYLDLKYYGTVSLHDDNSNGKNRIFYLSTRDTFEMTRNYFHDLLGRLVDIRL